MINLHESMGPGRDQTRDPWICSHIRICYQTRYRLRHAARYTLFDLDPNPKVKVTQNDAQYPRHHVTYAPAKFDVATSHG